MCCVVRELGGGEVIDPVVLKVVDEAPEVLLQHSVESFGLAVRLWVERSREAGLGVDELEELDPPGRGERGAAVRDDV